ncbi:SRPN8 [Trypoxylus dichotomus]
MRIFVFVVSASLIYSVFAQIQPDSVSAALNQFALNFIAETCTQAGESINLALSPYTIWNVMAIINEGANKNTEAELERVLGIPSNATLRGQFRKLQQSLNKRILKNSNGVSLDALNAVFTRLEKKINPDYKQLIEKLYNVEVTALNFNNAKNATMFINSKLANVTRGRISEIISENDLSDAQIFVTSALFFKGQWDLKFNKSITKEEPFYNERREVIGNVEMMYNKGLFPLTKVLNDKAFALELPYMDNKMSMIIILPVSTTLQTVLDTLAKQPFTTIMDALRYSTLIFGNDPVKVYIPKFKILSHLNLNFVLDRMGIKDVFSSAAADLLGISSDPMHLSRVVHKAEIEVDEDGTVASSISAGEIENKQPPIKIKANRPFAYFVYDKETQSIVFMGKYSLPV